MTILIKASGSMNSSTVAIGVASVFVALSALLSFVPDRHDVASARGAGWALRGTLTPDVFKTTSTGKDPDV